MKPRDYQITEMKHHLREEVKDFAYKVYPVYELLKWGWGSPPQTPRIKDIEITLYGLISDLSVVFREVSTGGFRVGYNFDANECVPYIKMEIAADVTNKKKAKSLGARSS